jgi:hypothetical protein
MPIREKWIENTIAVLGGIGTIFGIFTYIGASYQLAITFVAGAGWALVTALPIMAARSRVEVARLDTELKDIREQSQEWRLIAGNDSDSLNKIISRAGPAPRAAARRAPIQDPPQAEQAG